MQQPKQANDGFRIASPCPARWSDMKGDERVRHCGLCRLNVYNVEGMTRAQAERLLSETEGRLCLRISRRADGTLITKDCPIGREGVRRRFGYAVAASLAFLMTGIASAATIRKGDEPTPFKTQCLAVRDQLLASEPFCRWFPQPQFIMGESIGP